MVFSSLSFLLLFLPIAMALYYITPDRYKNIPLLIMSLFFYAWGEPVYVLVMIGSIVFNYVLGLFLTGNNKKLVLAIGVSVDLILLCGIKYLDMLIGCTNFLIATEIPLTELALPIGISFYTFQTLSYLVDVYRGEVMPAKNPIAFAAYVSMFPQLIAGPIVRYSTVEKELRERKFTLDDISDGILRFCIGLGKKVLIANQVGAVYNNIQSIAEPSFSLAWLSAISFTLQIYFDFSGYSDMAIGLGKMLGFSFPENFKLPYLADSITDFWRRWHISLSSWFKEYLYIPLGGNRRGVGRHILNLIIVWGLTGLWHGAEINFLIWGLYYGVLLILEKYVWGKWIGKLPRIIRSVYALFFIIFGWVLFDHSGEELLVNIKALSGTFGFDTGYAWYLFSTHLPLYITAILLSFGMADRIKQILDRYKNGLAYYILKLLICMTVFALSVAELLRGAYNPFLYFRF